MEHRPPSHDIIHAPSLEQIGFEEYEPPEGFCVPVRLRFSPALAYRVYDEFDEGCVTRGADGSLVVSVSFPEDPWLYGYLLSFGLGVEVLEPERLRKRLALLAGKMAATETMTRGVRITVIGWSHLNHRRNLT